MASSDNELEILNCPVCYEMLRPPVETCQNGHGFCKLCITQMKDCGVCRKKFTGAYNTLLNQTIEALINLKQISLKCQFAQKGCKQSDSLNAIEDHEKICSYRDEKCIACGTEFIVNDLNAHFTICQFLKAKTESEFFTWIQINYYLPLWGDAQFFALHFSDAETYFLQRFIYDGEQILFSIQYMGKDQENSRNYNYDLRIDRKDQKDSEADPYCYFGSYCVPYVYSVEGSRKQKGVIEINLKSIFPNNHKNLDKIPLEIRLYRVSTPTERLKRARNVF